MLGYISSTRKKSCRQCVKAKRRCDLGYPCCKRCSTKALDCAYPNAEAHHRAEVVIKATPNQPQPATRTASTNSALDATCLDFGAPMEPAMSGLETTKEWDGWCASMGLGIMGGSETDLDERIDPSILLSSCESDGSSPPDNTWPALDTTGGSSGQQMSSVAAFDDALQLYSTSSDSTASGSRSPSPTAIHTALLPEIWAPSYLNPFQVRYIVAAFRSFVPALAKNGHNSFIHSQFKIAALIASSHTWTLEEHLAAVQAMIVYQTIMLFDPSLKQQASAAPHNDLLALWAAHLWKRSFTTPIPLPECHSSWVFYESLRRTVLMSVVLRGGWHCITHAGICNQVPVLARLPLSTDEQLWTENENNFMSRTPCDRKKKNLMTYGEWAQTWTPGRDDPALLSDFQRMLLVACRGKEDPRLFFKDATSFG
ncbi:unnamed protein product [Periconia digitata]|uniref:Zn(2)-C6 fungal-type domain-containing protein n=1 Tax=Periconia digitata TaxID=1303443 RepID=A0A9W4XS96_9PLEO|nr:unnamed protein product [Periconia digitata]